MALYHKWDVKNGFAYVLQFFSLISDGLGGVHSLCIGDGKNKYEKICTKYCTSDEKEIRNVYLSISYSYSTSLFSIP